MATPPSPVLDDQDQNQTSQAIASSTIPNETQSEEGLQWEPWLKEYYDDLVADEPLNKGYLDAIDKRDKKFGGTATHGLARSSTSFTFEIMEKISLKMPLKQLVKTDKDKDLPVHSAIQSGTRVDQKKIGLFVQGDRQQIKKILRAKNINGKTPIELAFETHHRTAVKLLFDLCVEHNVLSSLTGINLRRHSNFFKLDQSNTLLHIACKEGMWPWFLKIIIDACTGNQVQHDILPAMQVLDKEDCTPFHYLMNCIPYDSDELDTFRAVLDLLKQKKVDINKIYTDSNRRTMLHKAQRSNNTNAVSLLVEYEHEDVPDKQGIKPYQRVHHIDNVGKKASSRSPSECQHDDVPGKQGTTPSQTVHHIDNVGKKTSSRVLSEVSDTSSASTQSYSRGGSPSFPASIPVAEPKHKQQRVHHIKDMDKRVASLVLSEASDASSSSAQSYSCTSPFHSGTQVFEGKRSVRSSSI